MNWVRHDRLTTGFIVITGWPPSKATSIIRGSKNNQSNLKTTTALDRTETWNTTKSKIKISKVVKVIISGCNPTRI